jgi:hypothetical protein
MTTLTKREAKRRRNAIDASRDAPRVELDKIEKEYAKAKKAWAKKWEKVHQKAMEDETDLRDTCPHDMVYEMSHATCSICGMFHNRSH